MLKRSKKLLNKGIALAMKTIPIVVPALLIVHTNSTMSAWNYQPEPPKSIKQYRKF